MDAEDWVWPGWFGWEEFWCLDVGPAELEDLMMLVVQGLCDLMG